MGRSTLSFYLFVGSLFSLTLLLHYQPLSKKFPVFASRLCLYFRRVSCVSRYPIRSAFALVTVQGYYYAKARGCRRETPQEEDGVRGPDMGRQEGRSVIPLTNSAGVTATATTVAGAAPKASSATIVAVTSTEARRMMKMNAIKEAVLSGVLFFTQPAYPHPVPYPRSCPGQTRSNLHSLSQRAVSRGGEVMAGSHSNGNVPTLPPELYSLIAYHLYMDASPASSTKETLLNSCSLVSSAWLLASRMYTFRTVKLTYSNVYQFVKLLEDPKCSFLRCVKRLEMKEGEYAVDRWMNDVLPRLVQEGRMQSVEVLDIYNLTWAELSPQAAMALTEGFAFSFKNDEESVEKITTMKSLRVGTCYWECVHDFFEFLSSSSFAGLKTLVCDSVLLNCGRGLCRCSDVEEGVAETPSAAPNGNPNASRECVGVEFPRALKNLYLGSPEEKTMRWFLKVDAVCGLEKLGLLVKERTLMELVGQLMGRAVGVKELALDLPAGCGLTLANNTHLRSLRIHVDLSSFSPSPPPTLTNPLASDPYINALAWLLDLISSIASPHIHYITLHLDFTVFSIGNFRSLWPWQDFINAINGLKSLKRVVFIVSSCRRRALQGLKEVVRGVNLDGSDAACCKVRVRGVKSSYQNRWDSGSAVWGSWIED